MSRYVYSGVEFYIFKLKDGNALFFHKNCYNSKVLNALQMFIEKKFLYSYEYVDREIHCYSSGKCAKCGQEIDFN